MSDTRRKHAGTLPKGTVTYRSAAQKTLGGSRTRLTPTQAATGQLRHLIMLRRANCKHDVSAKCRVVETARVLDSYQPLARIPCVNVQLLIPTETHHSTQ